MTLQETNPLLQPWDTPYGLPPFDRVRPEHYIPAFEVAMRSHADEIRAIAASGEPPTFENTLAAFDRSGGMLTRIELLFSNLTASETSPALQDVEREMAPRLAAHHNAVYLDAALFARIASVHGRRAGIGLDAEQLQVLERVHLDFVRAGALLPEGAKRRLAEVNEELATLTTRFSQNVLADEKAFELVLHDERDLAGLSDLVRAAAREAARERGHDSGWVITLSRSLIVPFLTFSDRRDLREQAFKAWTRRGESSGPHDNRPVAREILALRNEQARLHGYDNYADYALVDRMAGTPAAVAGLLTQVWEPAKAKAAAERDDLAALARSLGHPGAIEPWDWRYFAEKVRQARYDFSDAELKPYFSLDRMLEAAFDCAHRLFGVRFIARPDLKAYHPDVRVYEVHDRDGGIRAIFLSDNFARPSKRGGAWMSVYRVQSRIDGEVLPIVVNNNNFAKAPEGEPTLLSADDVRTLFHEFGHGLHGMLSQVRYQRLSGTRVLRDFVELPSQLFEHWGEERAVLKRHALHCTTGAPVPDALLDRLQQARQANQGFETVEYTASALVDMALHARTDEDGVDITVFEQQELARIGMPREIQMRHRLPHFGHLFSGSSYAAGYYVYMWAEVLDADGYNAFVEAGDPFAPDVAARLLRYIYSTGGTLEPGAAFRAFRGRDPSVEPMLVQRGLIGEEVAAAAD
ncbi:MAG: M3 family metallopeptidase [Betaproteobacteria bacterium]|nr:M3 family metallopeptidase [Betaproteobacteria bacterium]